MCCGPSGRINGGTVPAVRHQFFESAPLSPTSNGMICRSPPGSNRPSELSAAQRSRRGADEMALRFRDASLNRPISSDVSGGDGGGSDPVRRFGVMGMGVGGGLLVPCIGCVGVSSWNTPFMKWCCARRWTQRNVCDATVSRCLSLACYWRRPVLRRRWWQWRYCWEDRVGRGVGSLGWCQ